MGAQSPGCPGPSLPMLHGHPVPTAAAEVSEAVSGLKTSVLREYRQVVRRVSEPPETYQQKQHSCPQGKAERQPRRTWLHCQGGGWNGVVRGFSSDGGLAQPRHPILGSQQNCSDEPKELQNRSVSRDHHWSPEGMPHSCRVKSHSNLQGEPRCVQPAAAC